MSCEKGALGGLDMQDKVEQMVLPASIFRRTRQPFFRAATVSALAAVFNALTKWPWHRLLVAGRLIPGCREVLIYMDRSMLQTIRARGS